MRSGSRQDPFWPSDLLVTVAVDLVQPLNIKTDQALLERLKASGQHVSKDQLRHQRVSFIFGALPTDSNITRQQIETTLKRNEGEAA